ASITFTRNLDQHQRLDTTPLLQECRSALADALVSGHSGLWSKERVRLMPKRRSATRGVIAVVAVGALLVGMVGAVHAASGRTSKNGCCEVLKSVVDRANRGFSRSTTRAEAVSLAAALRKAAKSAPPGTSISGALHLLADRYDRWPKSATGRVPTKKMTALIK